jgi:uncharacterized protein (TIGR03083 family)
MDTFDLVAAERIRLADALEQLAPDDWDAPSLCQGWTLHQVAAHLNAPWSVSIPSMALTIARSFGFDRGIDRVARDLAGRLDPAACVAGLRDHADSRFTPPGAGPEAPLTDVLVDGGDTLRPFGRSVDSAPEARTTMPRWLAAGRAKGFVPRGALPGWRSRPPTSSAPAGPGRRWYGVRPWPSVVRCVDGRHGSATCRAPDSPSSPRGSDRTTASGRRRPGVRRRPDIAMVGPDDRVTG